MTSLRAQLLASMLILFEVKHAFDGPEPIARAIAADRRRGPAEPGSWFRARFAVRTDLVGGCRVHTVGRRGAPAGRHVLYLHGGAFALSINPLHWAFVGRLVERLDCTVTLPCYPLAPEHNARDVWALLLPLYRDLVAEVEPSGLTVMGDSAGGNLALSLAMQARDVALPLPATLVMISPSFDLTLTDPAMPALDRLDPILSLRVGPELARMYAAGIDLRDPLVSPLFGSLRDLPPMAIFTGTHDLLNADAHRLREKAAREGARLAWFEYPAMVHVWPLFPIPEARRALREIAAFVMQGAAAGPA